MGLYFKVLTKTPLTQGVADLLLTLAGVAAVMFLIHALTGQTASTLEILGTVANVWGMLLVRRQNIAGWVGNILASLFIGVYSWDQALYGQVFLQLGYFLPFSFYAIYVWRKQAQDNRPVAWLHARGRVLTGVACVVFLAAAYFAMPPSYGPWLHLADMAGLTFVLVAYFLMARRYTDCWLLFLPGDVAIIILYTLTGGYLIAALNVFFLVNGLYALWQWTRPVPEKSSAFPATSEI